MTLATNLSIVLPRVNKHNLSPIKPPMEVLTVIHLITGIKQGKLNRKWLIKNRVAGSSVEEPSTGQDYPVLLGLDGPVRGHHLVEF